MFNAGTIAKQPVIYTALLHFEGANNGTTFEDEFNANWSDAGNSATLTAKSKFGGSSLSRLVNSGGNSIASPTLSIIGTGDFTIDFWVNLGEAPSGLGSASLVAGMIGVSGIIYGGVSPPDRLRFSTSSGNVFSPTGLTNDVWQHIALERYQGSTRLYLDGVQGTPLSDTNNYNGTALTILVPATPLRSYLDEFRFIHNRGVYEGTNFTPNTQPYRP